MMTQVAEGVLTHQSELLQINAVVVQGRNGVLVVDPGFTDSEMACLAHDLRALVSTSWPASRRILTGITHGHAALLVEGSGVLVAGDMLSDVLIPMLDDVDSTDDPIEDYLVWLRSLESLADDVQALIPGHGSSCRADQVRVRIGLDRAYVEALREGRLRDDSRIGPSAKPGWEWVSDVHEGQVQSLVQKGERDGTG